MAQSPADAPSSQNAEEQLSELLQELRVALPGVQVLLAFLLTVPFNQRFSELDGGDTAVFFVAIVAAATASIMMIAPSAHHRFAWPSTDGELPRLVRIGTLEARAGLLALGVAIVSSLYVVADLVAGPTVALVTASLVAVVLVGLWLAVPLRTRRTRGR